ncbi:hypothetical protein DTO013E5_8226 [Penicillium roqueforti]|uniref:uncharacterized protein n=1 Tax=Penicillium roqueforti TaxID=5082 RepID=UPI00190DA0E1|nr:uncharacterized protein LCP9604111_3883 [Penicillium roqueforti]KAF9249783.1 hypothetical protein LCP9604111_3883 [Penicillium roqueforti]KAI1829871.1 hypothetical protein CBS147337_9378 [Penicillium roqueforti]KAI2669918.1 hypothetical protein CBS147355_9648 [Penicillium roqueforti]KAI2684995.1 hypothetical protein LCP963914a_5087 [Penicillium roqueforti]KAI2697227.1 hypothetical protein CBS147372_7965 [Penicillium roqueforti]
MDPGDVPTFLPELTQVEEMLVSRVHTIIEVRQIFFSVFRCPDRKKNGGGVSKSAFPNPDPTALNVTTMTAEEDPTQHLHRGIFNTLDQYGLPAKSLFHMLNATIPGASFPLLRVVVASDHSALVEVINGDHFYIPTLFPIHSTAELSIAFHHLKDEIVRLLDETLGTKWQLVCPFNIGRDSRSARPALGVGVLPSTNANWYQLQAHLTHRLTSHIRPIFTDIEFLPGKLSLLGEGDPVSFKDRVKGPKDIQMGCSIGVRGGNNASTLGGFVAVTYDGETHRGLLTNYLVMRPSPPYANLDTINREGVSPLSPIPFQGAISIESLARIDRDYTLTDLDDQLQALETQKARVVDFIRQRQLTSDAPRASSQQQLEAVETWEKTLIATRPVIQAMPHVLGDVHSASGLLVHGRRVIDWAFVELTPEAEERFFRPNRMPEVPRNQMPRSGPSGPPPALVAAGTRLDEFSSLQEDTYYIKQGRTTDVTGVVCNGVLSVCKWATRYDINGNTVDSKDLRTEEFMIIGIQDRFIEFGDSGSFVVDSTGAVAGLVFAEFKHNLQAVGLALTVPDLMDTMEGRLKGPVSLRLP